MKYFRKVTHQLRNVSVVVALALLLPYTAWAQTSSSPSYQVQEVQFGSGGASEVCSDDYCAQASTGANAVGSQSSASFDAEAGLLTDNEEFLEFVLLDTSVNLGELSSNSTATGTAQFYVRAYLSSSYAVYTSADSPAIGAGDRLDPMTATGVSVPGTEQFGINLVDNTSPDIGANLVNVPDDSFADGSVAAGYNIPNQFRYVDGEAIVKAPATTDRQGTGQTHYTISYIANVSPITPAGTYIMAHNLIAAATY